MRKIIWLVLFIGSIGFGLAQAGEVVLQDNFSDGDLTSNPTWQADATVHPVNRFTVVNDDGRKAIRASQRSSASSLFRLPANTGRPVVLDSKQGPISAKFDLRFESTVKGNLMVVYLRGPEGFVAVNFFQSRSVQLLFSHRAAKSRKVFVSKKAYFYDPKRYYSCELVGYPDGSFEVLIDGQSVVRGTPKVPITRFNRLTIFDRGTPDQGHLITNIVVSRESLGVSESRVPSSLSPGKASGGTLMAMAGADARREARGLVAEVKSVRGEVVKGLAEPIFLGPGRYRFEAKIGCEPVNTVGTRILFRVLHGRVLGSTEIRPLDIAVPGSFLPLKVDVILTRSAKVNLDISWEPGEFVGRGVKPHTELKKITVGKISYQRLPGNLGIVSLATDKITYRPGERPSIQYEVANFSNKNLQVHLEVWLARDLEPIERIKEIKVDVPGSGELKGQALRQSVSLEPLSQEGGYLVELRLVNGDKVLQTVSRCFAVSKILNRVAIGGAASAGYVWSGFATKKMIDRIWAKNKEAYVNWSEIGFWAPDDFQGLTPKENLYLSNVSSLHNREMMIYAAQEAAKAGILVNAYAKGSYTDGWEGFRFAREHPELMLYYADTGFPLASYNQRYLMYEEPERLAAAKAHKFKGFYWAWWRTDTTNPEVVRIAARAMISSIRMFGWGGVRFDGDFPVMPEGVYNGIRARNIRGEYPATRDDYDLIYARNLRLYKEMVSREFPRFEYGYNIGHDLDSLNPPRPKALAEMCRGGGLIMNESIRGSYAKGRKTHAWIDYAGLIVRDSVRVRAMGGYYLTIGFDAGYPVDYLYQSIFTFAGQIHPFGAYIFKYPLGRQLTRFVTRFSTYIYGEHLKPLLSPTRRIRIEAGGPIWWKKWSYVLDWGDGRRDYIIHLINPPWSKNIKENPDSRMRPALKGVKISMQLDPGETINQVFLLSPQAEDESTILPVRTKRGEVQFVVPSVPYWKVVVLRVRRGVVK